VRIFKNKWFIRFAYKSGIDDGKLVSAIDEAEDGIIDADLGGGLVKKRIAREGAGKRGGYRTIIVYQRGKRAFFVYGFPKNAVDNIDDKDLADLKSLARIYAKLSEDEISKAVERGVLTEVFKNGKKIQK
jgi:hypothetical protein